MGVQQAVVLSRKVHILAAGCGTLQLLELQRMMKQDNDCNVLSLENAELRSQMEALERQVAGLQGDLVRQRAQAEEDLHQAADLLEEQLTKYDVDVKVLEAQNAELQDRLGNIRARHARERAALEERVHALSDELALAAPLAASVGDQQDLTAEDERSNQHGSAAGVDIGDQHDLTAEGVPSNQHDSAAEVDIGNQHDLTAEDEPGNQHFCTADAAIGNRNDLTAEDETAYQHDLTAEDDIGNRLDLTAVRELAEYMNGNQHDLTAEDVKAYQHDPTAGADSQHDFIAVDGDGNQHDLTDMRFWLCGTCHCLNPPFLTECEGCAELKKKGMSKGKGGTSSKNKKRGKH